MKLITTQEELSETFISLLSEYKYISFATAWASSEHPAFEALLENKKKIKKSTIGIHFYQTEPEVLKHFKENKNVKFALQSSGVFHPKIYLFWNSKEEFQVLIGSSNFTKGAFLGKNLESTILVNNNSDLFQEIDIFLCNCFNSNFSKKITESYILEYTKIYNERYKNLETLSNIYTGEKESKSVLDKKILTYSWKEYFEEIIIDKSKKEKDSFSQRITVLEEIQEIFSTKEKFKNMDISERKHIAGLPNEDFMNSGWFGSMKGSGYFYREININNHIISDALDIIPVTGNVEKENFIEYFKIFKSIDTLSGNPMGCATRLLSMKRPDLFFCINMKNNKLGKDLGIKNLNKVDEIRYWNEFLRRIYDTPWFNSPEPKDPIEKLAWKYRVALIDCIYYEA